MKRKLGLQPVFAVICNRVLPAALAFPLACGVAHAGAIIDPNITINDTTGIISGTATGFDTTSLTMVSTNEGPGTQFGGFDVHGEWVDANALSPGNSVTYNYNILDPDGSVGDTLNVVLTGHTPTGTDANNMSVDEHFRSDSADETSPPALSGGILDNSAPEFATLTFANPSGGAFGLTLTYDSRDVPEPASLALFGAGIFGLFRLRRHRREA